MSGREREREMKPDCCWKEKDMRAGDEDGLCEGVSEGERKGRNAARYMEQGGKGKKRRTDNSTEKGSTRIPPWGKGQLRERGRDREGKEHASAWGNRSEPKGLGGERESDRDTNGGRRGLRGVTRDQDRRGDEVREKERESSHVLWERE